MPIANLVRGRWGEDLAAGWYTDRGYPVVARNWRCPIGEIDLVARRRRLVVVSRSRPAAPTPSARPPRPSGR